MLTAFVLSLLAALPDALLALWLKLLGEGLLDNRPVDDPRRSNRSRRVRHGHMVSANRQHPSSTTLPRQGDDLPRVARRQASGVGRDHRAPRASGLSRSPRGTSRSGVRARSHVHVAFFHLRVDPATGGDDCVAGIDSSRARAARALCAAHRTDVHVAARRGARSSRAWRLLEPSRAASLYARDHRAARQGSSRHRHRSSTRADSAAWRGSTGID